VVPLAPGEVFDGGTTASYRNRQFKRFQSVRARVDQVFGEFYWRVEVGELVHAQDFVAPPEILSSETSGTEIVWSHGTYMNAAEVASAFEGVRLETARTVGMAQPNPLAGAWRPWVALVALAVVVGLAAQVFASRRQVLDRNFRFDALASADGSQVAFTDAFELEGLKNVQVELAAPVDNSWAYVEGDLVNEETGLVQAFSAPIEYYHGVDGGESWSEGSPIADTRLSALPAGRYSMRLEAQWERWQQPLTVAVTVRQGVPRLIYWFVLLGVVSLGLVAQAIRARAFEVRRWSESMYSPYESSDD
jgi:hypothetical protein